MENIEVKIIGFVIEYICSCKISVKHMNVGCFNNNY